MTQAQGKLLFSSNEKHPFQISPSFTGQAGLLLIENIKLANLSYLYSRIVLASRFVFTRHCLTHALMLMLGFVVASLVKFKNFLFYTPAMSPFALSFEKVKICE